MVAALQEKFADFGLTYCIGEAISFDIFPQASALLWTLLHWPKHRPSQQLPMMLSHFVGWPVVLRRAGTRLTACALCQSLMRCTSLGTILTR